MASLGRMIGKAAKAMAPALMDKWKADTAKAETDRMMEWKSSEAAMSREQQSAEATKAREQSAAQHAETTAISERRVAVAEEGQELKRDESERDPATKFVFKENKVTKTDEFGTTSTVTDGVWQLDPTGKAAPKLIRDEKGGSPDVELTPQEKHLKDNPQLWQAYEGKYGSLPGWFEMPR